MTRRRGKPNWGRSSGTVPAIVTEFETEVRRLGLTREKLAPVHERFVAGVSATETAATYQSGCLRSGKLPWSHTSVARRDPPIKPALVASVRSKLKCPLFVACEMSGFKVVPSPSGPGWFWGMGLQGKGAVPLPLPSSVEAFAARGMPAAS